MFLVNRMLPNKIFMHSCVYVCVCVSVCVCNDEFYLRNELPSSLHYKENKFSFVSIIGENVRKSLKSKIYYGVLCNDPIYQPHRSGRI